LGNTKEGGIQGREIIHLTEKERDGTLDLNQLSTEP